ncbi:50S ribosomal protein L25 [Bacteroides sp. CAG:545]|jgi:large subunit ribosomal protein L25|nr:50S ribosomal protein L25 [Bacteroides sp. CAG:545]
MKHFVLKGQVREVGNKAVIKEYRKQGLVPCNIYGSGVENILFTVTEKDLKGLTDTPASYIVDLELSNGQKYNAVIHELQYHPVKDNCLHADFLAVNEEKPISIMVPITITGHAAGVRAGGKFYKLVRELKVSALMKDLPDELVINIDKLQIGKRIVAGDLKYENVNVVSPKGTIICTVKSSRQVAAHIEYEEALDEAMEEGVHHAEAPAAPAAEAPAEA